MRIFVHNLNTPDSETNITHTASVGSQDMHEIIRKYVDDILEYARQALEGDLYDDDDDDDDESMDDEYQSEDEGADDKIERQPQPALNTVGAESGSGGEVAARETTIRTCPVEGPQVATIDAEAGINSVVGHQGQPVQVDAASNLPEGKGMFGDMSTWSLIKADSRFQNVTNRAVTKRLKKIIQGAEADAAFCCGGSIPIVQSDTIINSSISSAPVVLRFDTSNGKTEKVTFEDNATTTQVDFLVEHCQSATFGVGNDEVLDKSYRDAVKLDPAHFSTNLHPYDLGILDSVSKTLLPPEGTAKAIGSTARLRAELYKLNVYSGPSGKFKPHVDTPRSEDQVGSLVICMPAEHKGGDLVVRHQNRSVTFCWGASKCIEWAAFYSSLEHEVTEVRSGHPCDADKQPILACYTAAKRVTAAAGSGCVPSSLR